MPDPRNKAENLAGRATKSILDPILDFDISKVTKGYQKHIGSRPALESLLLGGGLGYAAYKATPWLARPLLKRFGGAGTTDRDVDIALAEAKREGRLGDAAKIFGGSAAALGVLYPFLRDTNFHGSGGDALRSYLGGRFYSQDEPIAQHRRTAYRKARIDDATKARQFPLGKTGSAGFQNSMETERIPLSFSMDLLQSDPFLREPEKTVTTSILQGSEDGSGLTNGQAIARTAVRAGVGFIPSYAFGRVMTGLAGLPKEDAKRFSLAGGVAGAIYNTGLIQEFMKR